MRQATCRDNDWEIFFDVHKRFFCFPHFMGYITHISLSRLNGLAAGLNKNLL
jgi:hypothetical protein